LVFSKVSKWSNSEIVTLDYNNRLVTKYDHQGDTLTYSKNISGNTFQVEGEPTFLTLDRYNNSIVVTTAGTYIFDQSLYQKDILKTSYIGLSSYSYKANDQLIFDIGGNLQIVSNCLAAIYDNYNNLWIVGTDGNLYLNNTPLPPDAETFAASLPFLTLTPTNHANLAIDPNNNLWILNDKTKITILNLDTYATSTFNLGVYEIDKKNISFINSYDRLTNNFTWYGLVYFDIEKVLYYVDLAGNIIDTIHLDNTLNLLDPLTVTQDNSQVTFTGKGDFTGYEYRRIFNKALYNNNPQIQFKVSAKTFTLPAPIYYTYNLSVPVQYLVNNAWHLITATYKNNTLSLYIDNFLRDTLTIPSNLILNYDFKNSFFIGTPSGRSDNLNGELNTTSIIWNGAIDTVRIYDYSINPSYITYFIREKTIASDMVWNIPTTPIQYIETIDRFFKHQTPGSKSTFFNIKIAGTQITDPTLRLKIENDIIQSIQKNKPTYTELLNVEWLN
jgi:hypothetical protein